MKCSYSIVIPFHNEEENLPALYRRLTKVMEEIGDDYELVFVDDGSSDRTQTILKEICALDPRVVGLRLRRNFGQTAALAAGFDYAQGDVIIALERISMGDDIPCVETKNICCHPANKNALRTINTNMTFINTIP